MSTKETMTLEQLRADIRGHLNCREHPNRYDLTAWLDAIDANLASQPAEQPRGEPVAYWAAIDSEGDIIHAYNADDGNGGEAARQEMNDWINGRLNDGGPLLRLVALCLAQPKPEQDHSRDATKMIEQAVGDGVVGVAMETVGGDSVAVLNDAGKRLPNGSTLYAFPRPAVAMPKYVHKCRTHAEWTPGCATCASGLPEKTLAVATPAEVTDDDIVKALHSSPELDAMIDTEPKARIAFAAYRLAAALTAQCQVRKDGKVVGAGRLPTKFTEAEQLGDIIYRINTYCLVGGISDSDFRNNASALLEDIRGLILSGMYDVATEFSPPQINAVTDEMVRNALYARAGEWSVIQLFQDEEEAPDIMRVALRAAFASPSAGAVVPAARTKEDYEQDEDEQIDAYSYGHMDGWNSCREAMLASEPQAKGGWLPVESAPDEGTLHVRGLYVNTSNRRHFDAVVGYMDAGGDFVDHSGDSTTWSADDYEWWHPLAAAPEVPGA